MMTIGKQISVLVLMGVVGCSGDKNGEEALTVQGNGCTETAYEGSAICEAWLYNPGGVVSSVLREDAAGIIVNIASSAVVNQSGEDLLMVTASGIPDYTVVFAQSDIEALNVRPNADTDFVNSVTTAQAGVTYNFGSDIGYRSNSDCDTGAGYG